MYWFGRFLETVLVALLAVIAVELYLGLREVRAIRAEQVKSALCSYPAERFQHMSPAQQERLRCTLGNRVDVTGFVGIEGTVDVSGSVAIERPVEVYTLR